MRLRQGHHLAYCTNVHPGETWAEVATALERHVLRVRERVCPAHEPYAIGLRLGDPASRELLEGDALNRFQEWLDSHGCYVFTINGFPFGRFHGPGVKERVYLPDWSSDERVAYTDRLVNILAALLPEGVEGSVSTVPVGFKRGVPADEVQAWERLARRNLLQSAVTAAEVGASFGRRVRIALEPEPLCWLETSAETCAFFDRLREDEGATPDCMGHLGVNYDACHLAVEYEEAANALGRLAASGIPIVKLHLSSALSVVPDETGRARLADFCEPTYLHQVVARFLDGGVERYLDLPEALETPDAWGAEEWRIHFHVPLNFEGDPILRTTRAHLLEALDALKRNPSLCEHLEMETYTWGVLPEPLRSLAVEEQVAGEYQWMLAELAGRGLA